MIFVDVSRAPEILVNSVLQKFYGCKMTEKRPKTLIKTERTPSSYRIMKEMQLLMGERYPPHINPIVVGLFDSTILVGGGKKAPLPNS